MITGASLQAKNSGSGPTLKTGSIAVQGGSVTLGADTGRTILLAGSGALASEEGPTTGPNLTLLDAGPTGHGGTISVIGGDDRAIQIFSGVAVPGTAQGVTTLRGASSITAKSTPGSVTKGRIVVGGTLSGTTANASSPSTTVGSGTNLTATDGTIELLSTGAASSSGDLSADGGSINLRGPSATVSGGSLRANGGLITVTGSTSTSITGGTLTANKSATTAGRVVVGGTLSDTTASASSPSTTVGSGANLTATDGTIELLSTDAISSSGDLAADGGSINLRGPSATVSGGSLRANSGIISVSGAQGSLEVSRQPSTRPDACGCLRPCRFSTLDCSA